LDGFGDVVCLDLVAILEVGHGAGDAQDPVIGAGGEPDAGDGILHLFLGFGIQFAEAAQSARRHLRIAVDAERLEALALQVARSKDALANRGGFFRPFVLGQLFVFHRGHLDVQIDPIEQRAGHARQVPLNQRRCAGAIVQHITKVSALAGMRCPFAVSP
jgi:hypothetical protein